MKKFACGLVVVGGLMTGCSHLTFSQPKPSVSTEMYSPEQQERYEQSVRDLKRQGYTTAAAERIATKQVAPGGTVYSDSLYNVLTGKSGK